MAAPVTDQRAFVVTLRAEPGVDVPLRALRLGLKMMLRYCGLRCTGIRIAAQQPERVRRRSWPRPTLAKALIGAQSRPRGWVIR